MAYLLKTQLFNLLGNMGYMTTSPGLGVLRGKSHVLGLGDFFLQILESRQQSLAGVAEGVATTPAALRLAQKQKVKAPIIEAPDFWAAVGQGSLLLQQQLAMLLEASKMAAPIATSHFKGKEAILAAVGLLVGWGEK